MKDARVLVIGASSGIGRGVAVAAVRAGASVVFSARRGDRLAEAIDEAGGGHAVVADVRSSADCARLVAETVKLLGGIDAVVYATGVSPLRRLRDTDDADWGAMLGTNLVGANEVIRALVPVLDDGAVVSLISSDSVGDPRPAMSAYAASKAALEELVRGWRQEHPMLRWTVFAVGPTQPTEFGATFDPELLMQVFEEWTRLGMVHATLMHTDSVASLILGNLAMLHAHPDVGLDYLVLRPPPVVAESADHFAEAAEKARQGSG